MKRFLLSLLAVLSVTIGLNAQAASSFEWGTATWNIPNDSVFDNIESFETAGLTLSYANPSGFKLTPFNIFAVDVDIFVDGSDTAVKESGTARGNTDVTFSYHFVEGHSYKLVTTGAFLAQFNGAGIDTLSTNSDVYTISFSIKGPEIVDTINVEGTMSLTITDQEAQPTVSALDVARITKDLGVNSLDEVSFYGLNPDGSHNDHFEDYYDGWRDADGDYAPYNGGWDAYNGHNAYPVVYNVKANASHDSLYYYFYDYWKLYDPNDSGSVPITTGAKSRPNTSYHTIIWDLQVGDSIVKYTRSYRMDEGSDYKASFLFKNVDKAVLVNATLHFVSQEAYAAYKDSVGTEYTGYLKSAIAMRQDPTTSIADNSEAQTVTIRRGSEDGLVDIIFSGYTLPMLNLQTGELTLKDVTKTTADDGTITYSLESQNVGIQRGMMTINYTASLTGTQAKDGFPELNVSLSQAATITSFFRANEDDASKAFGEVYGGATGIKNIDTDATSATETYYDINGRQLAAPVKGVNIIKKANGKTVKVIVK